MKIKEALQAHEEDIIKGIQRLVRIKSVREAPLPGAPFGKGCADALMEAMEMGRELGLRVKNVDNYAGHIEIGSGDEIVGVLNHLDVVAEGTGWDSDIPPYEAVYKDDCIFGRGTYDNKGPAVVSLYCLKVIDDLGIPLKRRVRLILGTDEETDWEDMAYYFEREPIPNLGFSPDMAYPICNWEKGMLTLRVDANKFEPGAIVSVNGGIARNSTPDSCVAVVDLSRVEDSDGLLARIDSLGGAVKSRDGDIITIFRAGKASHGSAPENGDNAVAHMLEILEPLYLGKDDSRSRFLSFARQKVGYETDGLSLGVKMEDEPSGKLTVNMGLFRLDDKGAYLTLDMRFPVTKSREDLTCAIHPLVKSCGLEVSQATYKAPLYVPPDSPLIAALSRAYERITGVKPGLFGMGGGTYARVLKNNGVAFGPGGYPGEPLIPPEKLRKGSTHSFNEFCVIPDFMKHARLCAEAIIELANC
ncbi:MAG: Sapep family Mn(2+)-dependent dipeptidase [Clostridiales bacterium]|jgi:succinyl-diaminopimelate desuccinylase|nr:Sapep family Mn(2+)-dependent dipeptidase [Clostridiales bacterium]